jgi:predicted outer membrane protein
VKDFATMLVRDQTEALDKLMDLREARTRTRVTAGDQPLRTNVNIHRTATDIPLTEEHQSMAERLSMLSGDLFDREFIHEMARQHRETISLFEAQTHVHGNGSASRNSTENQEQQIARRKPAPPDKRQYSLEELMKDVDTADFAREALPTLRHHLEEAEEIQKELRTR